MWLDALTYVIAAVDVTLVAALVYWIYKTAKAC